MALARFSSRGVAIRYVFPVLWMTSCCHITVLWRIMCIPKQRQNTTSITAEIPTKFCLTTKTRSTHCCETPKASRGVGNGRGCRKLTQRWLNLVKSKCQRSHLVTVAFHCRKKNRFTGNYPHSLLCGLYVSYSKVYRPEYHVISDNIYLYIIMEMEWQKLVRHALQHASRASTGQILVRHAHKCFNGSAAPVMCEWQTVLGIML